MLAAKYRIKNRSRIQRVKSKGLSRNSSLFTIKVLDRGDKEISNFCFIVSKKVSKLATQRNRIKRALEEAVRYNQSYIKNGFDMAFLAKSLAEKKSTQEIQNEVVANLKKHNLMISKKV